MPSVAVEASVMSQLYPPAAQTESGRQILMAATITLVAAMIVEIVTQA